MPTTNYQLQNLELKICTSGVINITWTSSYQNWNARFCLSFLEKRHSRVTLWFKWSYWMCKNWLKLLSTAKLYRWIRPSGEFLLWQLNSIKTKDKWFHRTVITKRGLETQYTAKTWWLQAASTISIYWWQ